MTTAAKRKRKPKLPVLLETEFQDEQLIPLLKLNHWRIVHYRNVEIVRPDGSTHWACPLQGSSGFVDIVAACGGRVAFLEVKSDAASESDLDIEQLEWLNFIAGVKHPAWWWMGKDKPEPNHVVRGNDSGWDVLVSVVRPRHWDWLRATFAMEAIQ